MVIHGLEKIGSIKKEEEEFSNTIENSCTVEPDNNTTTEILWIKLKLKRQENLLIGVLYGKQECKHCIKELEEEYEVIKKTISNYTETNNKIILVGDFNGKIGNDENGITNGDTSITINGRKIRSMVRTLNLHILNKHAKCEGKWTRVNTKNSNEKSIIDYAICSKTLSKDIMKVLIDDKETYKIKGKNKSDHNTFIIDIEKAINNNKICPKYSWKIN